MTNFGRGPDLPPLPASTGDQVQGGGAGGPYEGLGCIDGHDHRLDRRDELVREVAQCRACGLSGRRAPVLGGSISIVPNKVYGTLQSTAIRGEILNVLTAINVDLGTVHVRTCLGA